MAKNTKHLRKEMYGCGPAKVERSISRMREESLACASDRAKRRKYEVVLLINPKMN
jgi:hypothetical protein